MSLQIFLGKILWPLRISARGQLTKQPALGRAAAASGVCPQHFRSRTSPFLCLPLGSAVCNQESERPCAYFSSHLLLYNPALLSANRVELSPGEGDNTGQTHCGWWEATCREMDEENDTHSLGETMGREWKS